MENLWIFHEDHGKFEWKTSQTGQLKFFWKSPIQNNISFIFVFQTTLSFVVMDRNPMVLPNVLLADDNDDFMGSCNLKMTKVVIIISVFSFYFHSFLTRDSSFCVNFINFSMLRMLRISDMQETWFWYWNISDLRATSVQEVPSTFLVYIY